MAGESEGARLAGLVAVDAVAGLVLGLGVGLVLAVLGRAPGRPWRTVLAALLLVAGAVGLSLQGSRSAPVLMAEAARAGRLEAPLPLLTADQPAAVLIISLDTVRADALAHMPLLAARAQDAQRFEQARSPSAWTLPAMAAVHTGLPYPAHGAAQVQSVEGVMVRTGLDPTVPTLAEALQERGFVTLAATTNPLNGQRYGFHQGFDRFVDLSRVALRAHALRRATLLRPLVAPRPDRADAVVDQALEWLEPAAPGRFALWLHFLDAHTPYSAAPASFDPLAPCALPECFDDWSSVRRGIVRLDQGERAQVQALYRNDLAYLDQELDRLFSAWEEAGLMENSLILVLADHGEAFWQPTADGREEVEHGGSFREEIIRVPLLVWVPGRAAQAHHQAVDLSAVKPAILSWVDGQGLGPLDRQGDMLTPLGSLLFADGVEGCTDGRSKLVQSAAVQGRPSAASLELYDLQADPLELRPRSGSVPSHLVDCIDQARQNVGQGVSGDIGALRMLGYVD